MIQAGYSVETVQDVLGDIARVNGLPESEVLVFPNALLVSARGQGQHRTGAVTTGDGQLLLSQIDEVQQTVDAARTGVLNPRSTIERIDRIHEMAPAYGPVLRVLGYGLLSAALSVLLGASWTGVALAAALGLGTGAALLLSERVPRRYGALITVAIAFLVAAAVFLLLRAGWGSGIEAALLAPLVVLLPGALLTTAVLELSTGQMISGAGRAAAGAMQLVLLSAGIVTAGALVGVPDFDFSPHPDHLGPIAPWIAVAVFGVAISVHRCAPRRADPVDPLRAVRRLRGAGARWSRRRGRALGVRRRAVRDTGDRPRGPAAVGPRGPRQLHTRLLAARAGSARAGGRGRCARRRRGGLGIPRRHPCDDGRDRPRSSGRLEPVEPDAAASALTARSARDRAGHRVKATSAVGTTLPSRPGADWKVQ